MDWQLSKFRGTESRAGEVQRVDVFLQDGPAGNVTVPEQLAWTAQPSVAAFLIENEPGKPLSKGNPASYSWNRPSE